MKITIQKIRMKNYILLVLVIISISLFSCNLNLFQNPQPIFMKTELESLKMSPSQECFQRFRKLSPENEQINTLGRYAYFITIKPGAGIIGICPVKISPKYFISP